MILISVYDHNTMCSGLCVKKKIAKLTSVLFVLCCIVQFGVLVDCYWGWKTIKKKLLSKKIKFRNRVSPFTANAAGASMNDENILPLHVTNQIEHSNKSLHDKSFKKVRFLGLRLIDIILTLCHMLKLMRIFT